jgi:DNA-binding NtrC family response regulator
MATILLVDIDPSSRSANAKTLSRSGHETLEAANGAEVQQRIATNQIDLVVYECGSSPMDPELLRALRDDKRSGEAPVIVISASGAGENAVAALRAGASHQLTSPFEPEQLQLVVDQALTVARLRSENRSLVRELQGRRSEHEIVGESPATRLLLDQVTSAANGSTSVLLQGESGTGKELVARAIHAQSERRDGPFIRVNCAALAADLAESTLFGHERGAFAGALKRSLGAVERANSGSLLLDEIGELSLDLQSKLVRVLQESEIERVGGTGPIAVDVRVVATTSRNLETEVAAKRLRPELYQLLKALPIVVPPLRERRDDIALLAHRFAARAAADAEKDFEGISSGALELLCSAPWPGNVRQLQHVVERAVILSTEPVLHPHLFESVPSQGSSGGAPFIDDIALHAALESSRFTMGAGSGSGERAHVLAVPSLDLMEVERRVIALALALSGGNRTRAAGMLGINVRTLRRKLNGGGSDANEQPRPGKVA